MCRASTAAVGDHPGNVRRSSNCIRDIRILGGKGREYRGKRKGTESHDLPAEEKKEDASGNVVCYVLDDN